MFKNSGGRGPAWSRTTSPRGISGPSSSVPKSKRSTCGLSAAETTRTNGPRRNPSDARRDRHESPQSEKRELSREIMGVACVMERFSRGLRHEGPEVSRFSEQARRYSRIAVPEARHAISHLRIRFQQHPPLDALVSTRRTETFPFRKRRAIGDLDAVDFRASPGDQPRCEQNRKALSHGEVRTCCSISSARAVIFSDASRSTRLVPSHVSYPPRSCWRGVGK